jgi:hypothetical protein
MQGCLSDLLSSAEGEGRRSLNGRRQIVIHKKVLDLSLSMVTV